MKNATTIFYQNSVGILCQWKGEVIGTTATSIDIRFSKNKALRFNLKESGFLLVTKAPVKMIGVCTTERAETFSFDDNLVNAVIEKTSGNVSMQWNGKNWN